MFYLAIDQHRKQLTVSLRNEAGDVIERRQVSTEWERVRAYFADLAARASAEGGWMVIVEVCGFNDWLLALLHEQGVAEIVLVQPERRSRQKTDRRDANQLGELLWTNRRRLHDGQRVQNVRRIVPPSAEVAADRQLTALRQRLGELRTRTLNKIQHLLLKHNLQQDCPAKGLDTKRARRWLGELRLPAVDRLELDLLTSQWDVWDEQLERVNARIAERQKACPAATLIATAPGAGAFSSLALASRMDDVTRFPRPASLANYWGLTPGCRNSGDATARLGSITKEGSKLARFVLGQMVLHVLRRDPEMKRWYGRIKHRRGAKIARTAVMRRLTTILWHMVKHNEPYQIGGAKALRSTA
jgi:transposase